MAFYDQLNKGTYQSGPRPGSIEELRARMSAQKPKPQQKGNFFTDLMPAGGGIAGALTGAAVGTGVLPGIGTLIGGVLGGAGGSAAGKFGENVAEGNKDLGEGVLGEAALGGILSAPPIRLAKGLATGGTALAKGAGAGAAKQSLEKALLEPGMLAKAGQGLVGSSRGITTGTRAGMRSPACRQGWTSPFSVGRLGMSDTSLEELSRSGSGTRMKTI